MCVSFMAPGCSNKVKQNGISFQQLPTKDFTRLQKRLNNMKLKNPPNWNTASYVRSILLKIVMNET